MPPQSQNYGHPRSLVSTPISKLRIDETTLLNSNQTSWMSHLITFKRQGRFSRWFLSCKRHGSCRLKRAFRLPSYPIENFNLSSQYRSNLMSMVMNNKKCYWCNFRQVQSRWNTDLSSFFIRVFTLSAINRTESNINYILQEVSLPDDDLLRLLVRINGNRLILRTNARLQVSLIMILEILWGICKQSTLKGVLVMCDFICELIIPRILCFNLNL